MSRKPVADVSAILLAAGASTRFGSPKMLAQVEGEPLVARMARTFRVGGCTDVLVVLAFGAEGIAEALRGIDARIVWNPEPGRGMLSSVRVGLEAVRDSRWVAVSPADIPGIDVPVVHRLLDEAALLDENTLLVPTHRGRRGHPLLFATALRDRLAGWKDDARLSDLLRQPDLVVEHLEGFHEGILRDVDTPSDLLK